MESTGGWGRCRRRWRATAPLPRDRPLPPAPAPTQPLLRRVVWKSLGPSVKARNRLLLDMRGGGARADASRWLRGSRAANSRAPHPWPCSAAPESPPGAGCQCHHPACQLGACMNVTAVCVPGPRQRLLSPNPPAATCAVSGALCPLRPNFTAGGGGSSPATLHGACWQRSPAGWGALRKLLFIETLA